MEEKSSRNMNESSSGFVMQISLFAIFCFLLLLRLRRWEEMKGGGGREKVEEGRRKRKEGEERDIDSHIERGRNEEFSIQEDGKEKNDGQRG